MDTARIENVVEPLMTQEAAELVDIEWLHEHGRQVLRFYLDKKGGITLDDCEHLSSRISALLDETDLISGAYVLEVSSPGLDRVLKKEKDFVRFAGQAVQVRLKVPQDGRRNFKGILQGFLDGKVVVECEGARFGFPLGLIDEARLDDRAGV